MVAVTRVSSAFLDATLCIRSQSRSSIIIMNRIGPRTVPCGTPDITEAGFDSPPFAETCWYLPVRNLCIQVPILPDIPSHLSL